MTKRNTKQVQRSAMAKIYSVVETVFSKVIHHLSNYKDGSLWFVLTCLFALLVPMVAKLAIPSLNYDLSKFLSGGDIALFSMVIVTSLVIDHFVFDESFDKLVLSE